VTTSLTFQPSVLSSLIPSVFLAMFLNAEEETWPGLAIIRNATK